MKPDEVGSAIVLYKQIDLVIKVKEGDDAFLAAIDLHEHGLTVSHVLGNAGAVFGWCTEHVLEGIVGRPCVAEWKRND